MISRSTKGVRFLRLRQSTLRDRADFEGWIFALVSVDPAALDDTIERVNIRLPHRVLRRIDEKARDAGESRSGYIARLAIG